MFSSFPIDAHPLPHETLDVAFAGPPLSQGPLPALFFFFTTAQDALTLSPCNQMIQELQDSPLRIFSATLPEHGPQLNPHSAMERWATTLSHSPSTFSQFFQQLHSWIDHLVSQEIITPQHLMASGVSRGAFVAAQLTALHSSLSALLGFAPLCDLTYLDEFTSLKDAPQLQPLQPTSVAKKLVQKKVRFYIGNRDVRVGTERCFHFAQSITEANFHQRHRSAPVELIMTPSIGHKGHGTSAQTFAQGALWVRDQLQLSATSLPWKKQNER